jgi:PilZ domain-containing protein
MVEQAGEVLTMTVSRERRAERRRRVLLAAQAFAAGCSQVMECTIRNLSCGGAAVLLAASAPDTFELRIPRDGSSRMAKTVWKNGDRRGLVFADIATGINDTRKTSILDLRRSLQFEAVR